MRWTAKFSALSGGFGQAVGVAGVLATAMRDTSYSITFGPSGGEETDSGDGGLRASQALRSTRRSWTSRLVSAGSGVAREPVTTRLRASPKHVSGYAETRTLGSVPQATSGGFR